MIKSMTGFARQNLVDEKCEYELELRSVNHKYLDINIKLPKSLNYLEESIKKQVASKIKRGKIDVCVLYNNKSLENTKIIIQSNLVKKYMEEIQKIANQEIDIMEILKFPNTIETKVIEDEEKNKANIKQITVSAVEKLVDMKLAEGKYISEDLVIRLKEIENEILKIELISKNIILAYSTKLQNRIKELLNTEVIDYSRIAQEAIIFADKSSIEEEIIRMKSHILQLKNELISTLDIPIGKKMDFIIQEMNREVNTIGSKANCLEITQSVIIMKSEIENMREQIQNVE